MLWSPLQVGLQQLFILFPGNLRPCLLPRFPQVSPGWNCSGWPPEVLSQLKVTSPTPTPPPPLREDIPDSESLPPSGWGN